MEYKIINSILICIPVLFLISYIIPLQIIYSLSEIKSDISFEYYFKTLNTNKNWNSGINPTIDKNNEINKTNANFTNLNFTLSKYSTKYNSFLFYPVYNKQNHSIWISDILPDNGKIFEFNIEENKFQIHNITNANIITLLTFDKVNPNILWYVDPVQNIIGSYNIINHELSQYKNPLNSVITGIVSDNNQNLWMSMMKSNKIVKFDTVDKNFEEYDIPTKNSSPANIIYDEYRNCIWFVELIGQLGKLDLDTKEIIEYPNKHNNKIDKSILGEPIFVFLNPYDLNIYLSDHKNNKMISFDPSLESFRVYPLEANNGLAFGITNDGNGNLWIAQHITNFLVILDPKTGKNIQVDIPIGSLVQYIITDNNNDIWFVHQLIDGLYKIKINKNLVTIQ